jgi:DNA repair exonuclease SbcCD ATPase subunit
MLEVPGKAKLQFHWKVSPYDYSKEGVDNIREKAATKYGVPKSHVKVIPEFVTASQGEGETPVSEIVTNIQDPQFQLTLFKEYLSVNKIEGYDFDTIKDIDAQINASIDYGAYDKFRRYSINWVRWSNFLSYGEDNYFDFSNLKGLVLLNSEPGNQSGKTTFAVDLIHFLLFGKTKRYKTLGEFFNDKLPEATEYFVEGCIHIDGEDYIIKRTVTRPALKKRTAKSTASQKVEYYRVVGDGAEELDDYVEAESKEGENTAGTNKAIKDAIGKESDFDLIISVTGQNLDEIIEKKEAERGRLLARWIGLLPLEEKDKLAREKFNGSVKPYLLSNQYSTETLTNEITSFETMSKTLAEQTEKLKKDNETIRGDIETLERTRTSLLQSKRDVDQSLLKVDSVTLKASMKKITEDGKRKAEEKAEFTRQIAEIGEVDFSVSQYDKITEERSDANIALQTCRGEFKRMQEQIGILQKGEYCPTCGKKLDNVDNSAKIAELKKRLGEIASNGKALAAKVAAYDEDLKAMKEARDKFQTVSGLKVKEAALDVQLANLRVEYKEQYAILKEYEKNNEAIDKNNAIDIEIRNTDSALTGKRNTLETNGRFISDNNSKVERYGEEVKSRKRIIAKIKEERELVKNWKIYLDMVGKNGVSKMVLRKTLPVINASLAKMLSDMCNFDVEVAITEKGEVTFNIVMGGTKRDLSGGSGLEATIAALALRTVLANISTIPRPNFIVMDEVLGRVAKENYDNMRDLYGKILEYYDFVMQISHLEEIKDWHDTIVTVRKPGLVSTISVSGK